MATQGGKTLVSRHLGEVAPLEFGRQLYLNGPGLGDNLGDNGAGDS